MSTAPADTLTQLRDLTRAFAAEQAAAVSRV